MEVSRAGPASGMEGTGRPKKRTGTSKYDFFKVKVWLGENMDHYYVLSRFLICRMLTVTKIPYIKAVKIALETKKYLVDHNLQDVTQTELENVLFSIIRSKGFDEQYIDCYRMVTQFYQQRQPLCIIICGTAWTGKSTIAQQLASRINIPNVMQTDVIYELLRASGDSPLHPQPLWCRPGLREAALVAEFRREALVVRKGMDGDLIKTLSDGKPIIIEGMHLDPGLYIQDFGKKGIIMLPAKPPTAAVASPARAAHSPNRMYKRSMTTPPARPPAYSVAPNGNINNTSRGITEEAVTGNQEGVLCYRRWSASPQVHASQDIAPACAVGIPAGRSSGGDGAASSRDDTAPGKQQDNLQDQQQQQQCNKQQRQDETGSGDSAAIQHQGVLVASCGPADSSSADEGVAAVTGNDSLRKVKGTTTPFPAPGDECIHSLLLSNGAPAAESAGSTLAAGATNQSTATTVSKTEDVLTAAAGTVVVAAAAAEPCDSSQSSLSSAPSVVMLDELQVCAATAEAVALQQHWQQYQQQQGWPPGQQQQQQQLGIPVTPGSPYSSADSEGGAARSSPALSQEHSTTEVVSRQPSCCSPLLSQEPSASDVSMQSTAVGAGGYSSSSSGAQGLVYSMASIQQQQQDVGHKQDMQQQQQHSEQCRSAGLDSLPTAAGRSPGPDRQLQLLHVDGSSGTQNNSASDNNLSDVVNDLLQHKKQHKPHHRGRSSQQAVLATAAPASAASSAAATAVLQQDAAAPAAMQQRSILQQQQQQGRLAAVLEKQQMTQAHSSSPLLPSGRTTGELCSSVVQAGSDASKIASAATDRPNASSTAAATSSKQAAATEQQPQQHSNQQGKEAVLRPLFVPILVYMDEADHVLMQEEALAHCSSNNNSSYGCDGAAAAAAMSGSNAASYAAEDSSNADGNASSSSSSSGNSSQAVGTVAAAVQVSNAEALRRMRLLQEYLCAYEAQGLPVVKVSYGNFGEALDKLHEYILQCIKCAQSQQL